MAQQYCKDGHRVAFVCRDLEGNLSDLIKEQDFQLFILPFAEQNDSLTGYGKWLTVTQEQDAAETTALMQNIGKVDRVVVDSYAIDEIWEKAVRTYTNEIFVIDDLANRKHDCDILLDQNFYLNKDERYKGLVPEHCKLLLGPEHALLRDEFYQVKKEMKPRDGKLHNILVFYGGADATDETTKALNALGILNANGELQGVNINVVVGGSNPRKDSISKICRGNGFNYLYQVNNMAVLMAEADLMLGAGGSTTWERCFLGLPAIVTAVAENQFQVCEDCASVGIIHYLGRWYDVTINAICNSIRKYISCEQLLLLQRKTSFFRKAH